MRNKDIEKRIYEEFNDQKPELFQKILEQCPKMTEEQPSVWTKTRDLFKQKRYVYSLVSVASAFLLAFVLFGLLPGNEVTPYSVVAIDVNPSVLLELDENDKVINVITENEDAEIIVGDMDFIGVDSDVVIYALIGSMLTNGYINEAANSVLLSIQSDDEVKEQEMITALTTVIDNFLKGSSINGSIVTQTLDLSDEAEELSEEYNISEAKAELILRIIAIDPRMTVEELAGTSINDLNVLLESKNYVISTVKHTGTASTVDYISASAAYDIALSEFGLVLTDVVEFETELELEDSSMVFEVEIETTTIEYVAIINAKTGDVISTEQELIDEDDTPPTDIELLSQEQIVSIIVSTLELNRNSMTEIEFGLEEENGVFFYDVSFDYGLLEYDLEVDAETGVIYSNSQDEDGYDYDDD